ncbi:uncharacterized protein BJ212DRAFT_1306203, partial [Suillus subaureus]
RRKTLSEVTWLDQDMTRLYSTFLYGSWLRRGRFKTFHKYNPPLELFHWRVTEYQGIDNNDLHWNRSTGGSQSTRVSTTMISTGTVPLEGHRVPGVTEYQGVDNNDLHWNCFTGGSQSTRVSTTMISTGTVPSEARLHDKTKTLSLVKGSPSIGSTKQLNRGNYSDKNAKIKQNQAKSERGFDPGHKDKDKEYDSQDYDSKKSRKQAKDKDKDHDGQDYDTISKSRIRNAIVKTTIR